MAREVKLDIAYGFFGVWLLKPSGDNLLLYFVQIGGA